LKRELKKIENKKELESIAKAKELTAKRLERMRASVD